MSTETARTIKADSAGALVLTLILLTPGGQISVIADDDTEQATLTLRPARDGDAITTRLIADATVTQSPKKLTVRVEKATGIRGKAVIVGNYGGTNNAGHVALGPGSEVAAEIRVPTGSTVRLDHDHATITQDGSVTVIPNW